ncbi:hypothetical protein WG66_004113 [Moniliophthora roreri]|nr:hypothetical protein WG66_004113 [Moniliophthora roreri]
MSPGSFWRKGISVVSTSQTLRLKRGVRLPEPQMRPTSTGMSSLHKGQRYSELGWHPDRDRSKFANCCAATLP